MASWMVFLIIMTAILGGFFFEYKSDKKELSGVNKKQEEEINDLRKLVQQLKKRIENLEAIAAEAPEDFEAGGSNPRNIIEIDETSIASENRKKVAERAKTKTD
jgi:hypothetical protein